jgi:hypothetical protein
MSDRPASDPMLVCPACGETSPLSEQTDRICPWDDERMEELDDD